MHCEPWSPGRPVVLHQQAEGAAEHPTQRLCGGGRAGVGHRHGGSRDAGTVRCTMRYAMCFACWYGMVWCGVVWCGVWGGVLSYQTIPVCWMLSSVTVHLMSFLLFYMLYVSRSSHDVYPTVSLSLAILLPTLPIPIPTSNFYPNPYVTIITPHLLTPSRLSY